MNTEVNELADVFTGHPVGLGPDPAKLMRGHAQEIAALILEAGYGKLHGRRFAQEAKAKAWDEGYMAEASAREDNPYRRES